MNIKNRFIVLEGMDFSGKTTIAKLLKPRLEDYGFDVVLTREPGGCNVAERLREVLLSTKNEMTALTEAYLFMAGRNEHLLQTILPAINEGHVVICDRFLGSSLVYQGVGKEIGFKKIMELFEPILYDPAIEVMLREHMQTFLFDISHGEARHRLEASGRPLDRLDVTDYKSFTIQRDAYKQLPYASSLFQKNFYVLDADRPQTMLLATIMSILFGDQE